MPQYWTASSNWATDTNAIGGSGSWAAHSAFNALPSPPEDNSDFRRSVKTQIRGSMIRNG